MASQLDTLATQMPAANQKRQAQQRAASDLQIQQAVARAPKQAAPAMAQQLGGAVAQNAGQKAIEQAQQNLQQNQQVGGMAVQEQAQDIQNKVAELQRGQQKQALNAEATLSSMDQEAKQEMFDSRMQFQMDEAGRAFMNERQLADYAVTHAKDEQQLQRYMNNEKMLSDRKMQMASAIQARLEQELKLLNQQKNTFQNQEAKARIGQMIADQKAAIERERQAKAARQQKWTTGGQVVGMVVGGVIGAVVTAPAGGAGAAPGAAVGGQAGKAIGGYIGSQQG